MTCGCVCTVYRQVRSVVLACHHHIDELVLDSSFTSLFGPSASPDNPSFVQFRDKIWRLLDTTGHYLRLSLKTRQQKNRKEEVLAFYTEILTTENNKGDLPRADYKECAELMMILLGAIPPKGVRWYKPMGTHNARWMCTILYAAKIYAFSEQIDMDEGQLELYFRFLLFSALYYVPWWLSASRAVDAPVNDLEMWKFLQQYKTVDKNLATKAILSLERHLWYLTEELTPLCLFSDKLSNAEKSQMARNIHKQKGVYDSQPGQPVMPLLTESTRMSDLIGPKSWVMFSAFESTDWLLKPVRAWESDSGYTDMHKRIRNLKIVNDIAERGVKLVSDYSGSITTDEEQKQALYQVVEQHRRKLPNNVTKAKFKLLTINDYDV